MIKASPLSPSSKGAARSALTLVACFCACFAGPAVAQDGPEELRVTVGKSIVIDYPTDVARISTSNPEIVDAVAVSTREILLHAKAHGTSTVVIWAKGGQRTFYNVSVEHNLEPIRRILRETFPDEPIAVQAARDSLTLTGKVSSKEVSDRSAALAASLAKTVVNNLSVEEAPVQKQILLRVKFAELNRNASTDLGVNILSTGALNTPGSITTQQYSSPRPSALRGTIPGRAEGTTSEFNVTDALNIFMFRPDLNLASFVRALQSRGLLQILAEPNLLTSNGKEASFLVGGEFPVPVLQGGSNAGSVTIQFREFGIRLTFTPALTGHQTLRMYVKPEVSTIDLANAVTFSGFTIPALATRRIESNIELGLGQSFVIGGLIDDRVNESMSKIPGLANIPVLGALFKSRATERSKTELIVMVTPELVQPIGPGDAKPEIRMPLEFLPPIEDKKPGAEQSKSGKSKAAESARLAEQAAPSAAAPATGQSAEAPGAKPESQAVEDGAGTASAVQAAHSVDSALPPASQSGEAGREEASSGEAAAASGAASLLKEH